MPIDPELDSGVAIVTINRPEKKNATTFDRLVQIHTIFQNPQDDPAVRSVILTGAGGD